MTDNFDFYKIYVDLPETNEQHKLWDKYYVIELLRRGKDNPNMSAANIHFKNYYIYCKADIDKYKEEIKTLCRVMNMRAYASVNYKLMSQVALDTVAEMTHRIAEHDTKRFYAVFESASGKFVDTKNKRWVVDIDKEDADEYGISVMELMFRYRDEIIPKCKPNEEVLAVVNTKSGKHLITCPFDVAHFNELSRKMGMKPFSPEHQIIKKNHLTLLFEDLK